MILKQYYKKKKFNINSFFKVYFIISIFLIAAFFAIFVNTGVWIGNKEKILNRIYFNGLNHYLNIFQISTKAFRSLFYIYEEINLDLNYENLVILEKNRKEIISNSQNGIRAENQKFNEVKGFITFKEKKVPIKLRLKGDRLNHYREKNKISYKIEVLGEEKIKGIRKFSFIKPRIRNYIHEWIYHELAGESDLVKLKYQFVYLKVNGESQGLYVIEEGFDTDLIERNKRRNGPIFSIHEEYNKDIFKSKLEIYNKKYWARSENVQLASYARNKLKSFYQYKSSLEETFDIKKWAIFFALSDLTYTYHGLDPGNVKFYYNPISGLFEPIPFDGHRFSKNYNKNLKNFDDRNTYERASFCLKNACNKPENYKVKWLFHFFFDENKELNSNFYLEYIKALDKITDKKFLSKFYNEREESINKFNSAIYSDYFLIDNASYLKYGPGLYYFYKEDLFYRSEVLRKKIEKKLNKISATETENLIVIESDYNPNNLSLVLNELICEKIENNWRKSFTYKVDFIKNIERKIKIKKNIPELINSKCKYAQFMDPFTKEIYLKEINFNSLHVFDEKKVENKYLDFFYKENNILYLKNNKTQINEDIIIPDNLTVKIKSGDKILISNNAFIISNSPWEVGDSNGKVIIGGYKENFGGGLVIKNAEKASKFYNTEFKYLSGVENRFLNHDPNKEFVVLTKYSERKKNNYLYDSVSSKEPITFEISNNYTFSNKFNYTGAVNFYNTKVFIKNNKFNKIDSEDALNIISSNFLLEDNSFEENSSDAIDIDFGNGIIKNSNFSFIGNDAIDLSGSQVYLENLSFLNVGDKLISAGENTTTSINKISGKNSYVGIASKDGSITTAENIKFINVKIPFASYQKKKSYRHGILKINDPIYVENHVEKYIKDDKSDIIINAKKIEKSNNQAFNVVYKKKLSLINE